MTNNSFGVKIPEILLYATGKQLDAWAEMFDLECDHMTDNEKRRALMEALKSECRLSSPSILSGIEEDEERKWLE